MMTVKTKSPFIVKVDKDISLKIRTTNESKELFELVDKNRKHLETFLYWVPFNKTVKDSRNFIKKQLEKFKENTGCDFGIYYQNKLIGSGGFHVIDLKNKSAEIGYWIDKDFEGKGIVKKSVQKMVEIGKKKYKLHRITIKMEPLNERSKNIPKSLGFVYEGTERDVLLVGKKFKSLEVWALVF